VPLPRLPQAPRRPVPRLGDLPRRRGHGRETRAYAGRHFCAHCGSSVFSQSGDEFEVSLGALDEPDRFRPTYELWTVRREAWLPEFPLVRRYPRDRDPASRFEE